MVMNHTGRAALAALATACALSAQVKITQGTHKISIEIHGKPYSDFYVSGPDPSYPGADKSLTGADLMKPFLWPIRAASGTYVTRAWPIEEADDEKGLKFDHPHQRGVWFAHDTVNGSDFWNSYTAKNRGKIALEKVVDLKSGQDAGSISARFLWTGKDGEPVLTETRVMTFYDQPNLRTIDFDITLTAIDKVQFGNGMDTGGGKDGSFGIRLRPVLQEDKGTGHISNAEGLTGEKDVWSKRSNWCDYSGEISGEKVGVAILDHPANPGHPVRWHVRAYGLFAANPFGLAAPGEAPKALQPGESFRFRYRVIVHPGDAKAANIASEWSKYASLR
jgi:hypothetical protein